MKNTIAKNEIVLFSFKKNLFYTPTVSEGWDIGIGYLLSIKQDIF